MAQVVMAMVSQESGDRTRAIDANGGAGERELDFLTSTRKMAAMTNHELGCVMSCHGGCGVAA
jgi:hypothetical protein